MGHFTDSVGAFKIKYVDPRSAFNSLWWGILLTPSEHSKSNMLTSGEHSIHSTGHFIDPFKIKYVDPCRVFYSFQWWILLTPIRHLKLNMLTPMGHLQLNMLTLAGHFKLNMHSNVPSQSIKYPAGADIFNFKYPVKVNEILHWSQHSQIQMPHGSQSNTTQESIKCAAGVNQMPCGSQSNALWESIKSRGVRSADHGCQIHLWQSTNGDIRRMAFQQHLAFPSELLELRFWVHSCTTGYVEHTTYS